MQLRLKFVLLAVVPLLLAIAAVAAVVKLQSQALTDAEHAIVEPALMDARRHELQNYVTLALASIEHLTVRNDEAARAAALDVLSQLEFGDDGYFFVYDMDGRALMHPRQPDLVGRNLWEVRDAQGRPTIQNLIARAREGGGFVDFVWRRPSTGRTENKLGYVATVPEWGWMIGTGLYTDDIVAARERIDRQAQVAIRNTMGVIAGIAVVATLLVALAGLALNVSDRRDAEQKMRELARQVVRSQEKERSRVARELHDGVSQSLVSVKFLLESAQARLDQAQPLPDPANAARSTLSRGLAGVEEVLGDVRRISHGLRPTMLDTLGLVPAMRQVLDEFAQRSGVAVDIEADDSLVAPGDAGTALFRLLQEALNNVERHARATRLSLRLVAEGGALRLDIRDDGRGFDVESVSASPQRGLGLSSMRERIEALGGRFELYSDGSGTLLSARLPLT
ncbi:MAG: histidine kinase [Methyloversatilis sp.]|nr:histidine kinase [Methyloversatilis sp.]